MMSSSSCRSPTPTANGFCLLLTGTQTSEQKYNEVIASRRWLSTPYCCNSLRNPTAILQLWTVFSLILIQHAHTWFYALAMLECVHAHQ